MPIRSVRVLRTVQELESVRNVWVSWPGHRDSDYEFFNEFLHTRREVIRPHVVVVYRYGRPDAMLVGRLERSRVDFRIGYVRIPGLWARMLVFAQGGVRGNCSDDNCVEIINSLRKSLRHHEADLAFLHQVDVTSPLFSNAIEGNILTRDHGLTAEPRYAVDLPVTVEELYRSFSTNLRCGLRKEEKKLRRDFDGRIKTRCVQSVTELEQIIPDLECIAKKTYQRGLGVGFSDKAGVCKTLRFFAARGWLRIYVLYLEGKPCSFVTGTLYHGRFTADFTGYDPSLRNYCIGRFILITMLKDLCQHGVKKCELGAGQADYKQHFSNCETIEASVHMFALSARAIVLNALRTITVLSDRAVKTMLLRTALLTALKRCWRNRLVDARVRTA